MTGRGADAIAGGPVELGEVTRNGDWFEAGIVFPGLPEHVRTARAFTGRVLDGHPCANVAVQLVSELTANSVIHSDSSGPEGTIGVTVSGTSGRVKVEVADAGGKTVPELNPAGDLQDENGRGLRLVAAMSDYWGHQLRADGCVTWFLVKAGS
jgi:anti-sigma regulatory factor (Ser/Thr protein kinase)